MWGYIVLGVFVLFVITNFASFLTGMSRGHKQATAEYNAEIIRQQEDAKLYDQIKQDIKQGVTKDAEDKKAELAGHSNSRDQFNAINDSLSNKPKN